jgi:putative ABC transport system ATP-binding protein
MCESLPPVGDRAAAGPDLEPLIKIHDLRKTYITPAGPVHALDGATATMRRGITAIVGPSGGGKSTLIAIVAGLMRPCSGEVYIRGVLLDWDETRAMQLFRCHDVAVVFQDLNLIGQMTALENAAFPLRCQGRSACEAQGVARENLEVMGIGELAGRYPHQLSRGQKQRVAIARAFTSGAELIAADEPTGSLDPASAESVMAAFGNLARETRRSILLVTHDHQLAKRHADRALECRDGRLTEL